METDRALLEGFVSVRAVLKSGSRPVYRIVLRANKWDRGVAWLEHEAQRQQIPLERAGDEVISALADGTTHGGVVAEVGPRQFVPLDQIAAGRANPFVVMLDGVEDPFNFGQAVRTLYAAGADGLIVRPRNWMSAAGVVARASAGATEWMPTAIADTAQDAADYFRARGLVIACAYQDHAVSMYDADLTAPLFLIIGGEKRGITRSFAAQADLRLTIPYGRDFDQALGTAAAADVLAFEVLRQRRAEN